MIVLLHCALLSLSLSLLERHEGLSSSLEALQPFVTGTGQHYPAIVRTSRLSSQSVPAIVHTSRLSSRSDQSPSKNGKSPNRSLRAKRDETNISKDRKDDEWTNGGAQEGRFILFRVTKTDQGAGNYAQGLLAAHLLGLEFNRTVCLLWPEFFEAFDYANQEHELICKGAQSWPVDRSIVTWTFYRPSQLPDECALVDILASRELKVILYSGNTYPGWRTDIPHNLFYRYFRVNPTLLHALPYPPNNPPKVVVHLRSPDGAADANRGLDEKTLHALGERLVGNGTYLVTNRPDWYKRFHECCGWSYDTTWEGKPIEHGARGIIWDAKGRKRAGRDAAEFLETLTTTGQQESSHGGIQVTHNVKLWSDWYTMLNAEQVYHSNSDFSRSAVHWNANCIGYQLNGMRNQTGESLGVNWTEDEKFDRQELNIVPASYDSVPMHIPALVNRLDPGKRLDLNRDDCLYLRFCRSRQDTNSSHDG